MKRVYNFVVTIEQPIVKGHMVYEENLLPGLAYIDMLFHLAQDSMDLDYRKHCLKRLSIYNPLIVRENRPVKLEILFERVSDYWEIAVEGMEIDEHGNPLPKKLYITAEMHEETPQFTEQIEIETVKQAATLCEDMEAVYAAARKRGLVHQGMIKARGNIYLTDFGRLMEVNVDDTYHDAGKQVLFHPTLIDGAGMAAGLLEVKDDAGNNEDLYIPLYYESFAAIEPLQTQCYARVNSASLRIVNDVRTMDMTFFNTAGQQVAQLNGITAKRIRSKDQITPDLKKKPISSAVRGNSVSAAHPPYQPEAASMHIESRLRKIFSRHLNQAVSQIDIHTGFFEIGLESSQLLAIVNDIEKSFSLSLSPTLLFENNNIRELIDYVKVRKQESGSHFEPTEKPDNESVPLEERFVLKSRVYEFYEYEPFLQEHLVYGQPALMGVTHACLALEAYVQNNPRAYPVEMRNIQFMGGPVTLEKTESAHVLVQFDDDGNQKGFKTLFYLKDPNHTKPCCQGEYIGPIQAVPEAIDIEAILSQSKPLDRDTIDKSYKIINNFTIGPMLQTIDSAFAYDESTVISKVCLSGKLKKGDVSRFIFDPLLLNSCYLLCHLDISGKQDNIFIPLMIERLTIYRPMTETAYIVKTLRYKKTDFVSFDAMLLTEQGDMIAEIVNASVKEVLNPSQLSNASLSVNPAQSFVKIDRSPESDIQAMDIAIIGLNGRYPGARNIQEFWQNLKEGRDCITEIPEDRWNWQEYYTGDRTKPGYIYSKWGGFIADVDRFDPLFFNISPREAETIDPQERLFLEHCWLALEDAGYTKEELQKVKNYLPGQVGVYVGVMHNEYPLYAKQRYGLSTGISSIANRVSYYFDFHGPSMAIDTMCSSSLTALYMACQALKEKQIDVALAGGVNVTIHPNKYLLLSQGQFISSKGHCESFGEGGDGYIPGEGVGVLVLKRLADAERDSDNIYGVIKGVAINHGGRASGFTVPNQKAQSRVIADALKIAQINPRTISYLEAHGTGTSLGDPIEIAGLTKTFQEYTQDKQYCAIGSAKSNIGHCESAAGIAGITKVLLQLKHRQLVPSLHSKTLNPNIDFAGTPFIVQQELAEWQRPMVTINGETREYHRVAGISSFGAGGSNAHVVIEEYIPDQEKSKIIVTAQNPAIIVLSAKNEERLKEHVRQLLAAIHTQQFSDADLADIAYTLQVGREAMEERLAMTALSLRELEEKLQGYLDGQDIIDDLYRGQVKRNKEPLAIFTADEDLQKAIETWIAKGKYAQLLDLWVKGPSFNWNKLYGDTKPRRISLPTYPFAGERYWIPEIETRSALSTATSPAKAAFAADNHYVQRKMCFLKKQWELCLATPTRTLTRSIAILTTQETKELAIQLSRHFPKSQILDLHDLESQLRQPEEWKIYDGCVDLTGCSEEKNELPDWIAWLQQLIEHGQREDLMLLCVTKGLEAYQNTAVNLSGASRAGLYRMLQSEYGHLRSRHMDVDPATGDHVLAQQIASEFFMESEDPEICYRDGKRYRAYFQEFEKGDDSDQTLEFPDGHVLWITGGTRGIGYLCAQHFVTNHGVRRLVLTGRENMPPREEWDSYQQQNTSTAQKIRAIRALEAQGAKVQVLSVSLTDEHAVQQSLQEIKDSLGPIGGIIHCAGLGDSENPAFIRKSLDGIQQVLNPKVAGLDILYQCCKSEPLQFFILFSSVSGIIPTLAVGQSDYAMANAYLDYFAEAHSHICPIVSIQWPSWKETGMGEIKSRAYEQTGLLSMTNREGLHFLDYILSGEAGPVVMPAVMNQNLWKPQQLMQRRIQDEVSTTIQSRPPIDADASTASDTLIKKTQTWLTELFSHELKTEPAQLDIDTPFPDYGIDSILLSQILRQINRLLAESLDPSILLEYATIESLAIWLAGNYAASLSKVMELTISDKVALPMQDLMSNLSPRFTSEQTPVQGLPKVVFRHTEANPADIAVIGLSCRFPGASTLEEYWQLLSEGRSAIRSVPQERWGYTNHFCAGLLDNITHFDPSFFLIPQEDAKVMDPQALMVLEESLKLWYHAGYSHQEIKGKPVGVYLGARSQHQPDPYDLRQARNPIVAAGQNYLAANISQFFDLRGPSLVVDTACSSALVGMNMAIQALHSGEIDAALVGGVSLLTTDAAHKMFQQRGILSQDPAFHIFDNRANGVVLGEGVGLVLLKTVEQALMDGDHIYAVIKALAINNDGRTAGPATPNLLAQKDVMQAALGKSGKRPEEISYIEANGSGSEVTDLLELKAIQSVYRPLDAAPMGLGSIKPNIGHPLCAEGIASFIKVVLMLQYRQFVPFLSGKQPMAHYDLQASPFYFCRYTDSMNTPYTAAINCFADGGTNVHLILETWADLASQKIKRTPQPPPALNRSNVRGAKVLNLPVLQTDQSNKDMSKLSNNWVQAPSFGQLQTINNTVNIWKQIAEGK